MNNLENQVEDEFETKTVGEIVDEYISSNLQYGHKPREWNPKMAPYIQMEKWGYHVIDLVTSFKFIKGVSKILKRKAEKSAKFLFVGTNRVSRRLIKRYAEECNSYYINHRWLGGTITNWPTLQKRIERFKQLRQIVEGKEKLNVSKKDYSSQKKEYEKLKKLFCGIENMTSLPDMVIFTSQLKDYLAISECTKLGIPCIAITDTNCDPDLVPFPIPGNDDSEAAVEFILKKLSFAINAGYNKKKA